RSTLKVALTKRQEPGGVECLGPDLLRNTLAACQRTLQEDPAFIHMSMSLPEVKQGTTQAQGHLVCMLLQHPLQSSAQVGILAFQPLQPYGLLCALKVRLGLLCQSQIIFCMDLPSHLQLLVDAKCLQAILPNRLMQQQAWFIITLLALIEQVLIEQRRHPVQHLCALAPTYAVHGLYCRKIAAVDEDAKLPEKALFLV